MNNASNYLYLAIDIEGVCESADLNHYMGDFFHKEENYEKSILYYKNALNQYISVINEINNNNNNSSFTEIIDRLKEKIRIVKIKIASRYTDTGNIKFNNQKFEDAINLFSNALHYHSGNYLTYLGLGLALREISAYECAVRSLKKAARLNPENDEIYRALGDIYTYDINDGLKAIEYYEQYIKLNQTNGLVYNMLGHLYSQAYKYETVKEQVSYFEKAIELMPDLKVAHKNLTVVAPRIGEFTKALNSYKRLMELGPTMDDRFDLGCLYIKLKNFKEGWKYYEYRFLKENNPTPYPKFTQKKWNGKPVKDKTLLVQYEQGFGDSIQFVRYIPQLSKYSKKIIFRVQNSLVDLFKLSIINAEILSDKIPVEDIKFDYHVPIMSLPLLLDAAADNIPLTEGYLKADPEKINFYKEKFFNNDTVKIGISWQGHKNGNETRNIPLKTFYPISQLPNVTLYSFQKGDGIEEIDSLPEGMNVINLGSTFNDFSDTAAAMENLDIFISSDNSVINLAGAMGKMSYILLHLDSEWRWFLEEEKNSWYDSMRIFKQKQFGDWNEVFERIVQELKSQFNLY